MSNRRILITGATGGLGQALVREALARGHEVRATGRDRAAEASLQALGAKFVRCDLAAPDADFFDLAYGCHSVIHAAALSASWGKRKDFDWINVEATRRLLDAASAAGCQRFVFVSSPSIFASFRDRLAIGEHAPPADPPLNHYARTKLAAERLVLAPRRDGMAACAIRPRALVGGGDRVILPRLAAMARRRRLPLPGGGRALMELTDLRDAAWAICEAEERAADIAGRGINISGGRPVAVRNLAEQLAEALRCSPRMVDLPLPLARLLASTMEGGAKLAGARSEPPLTRYTLATLAYSQTFDPQPARRLLDFAPRHDAVETLLTEARKLENAA